ncbi:hypothetical protein COBT_001408 [Conglomerata obtusa]
MLEMLLSLFTKTDKQKAEERYKLLLKIGNTIVSLQRQITALEKQREEETERIKMLIRNGKTEYARKRYRCIKNIDDLVNRIYEQIAILETNKLCLIEEEGNRAVYDIMKLINHEYAQDSVKVNDIEKEIDKNSIAGEDRKEICEIYTTFASENENEYEDFLSSILDEDKSDVSITETKITKFAEEKNNMDLF